MITRPERLRAIASDLVEHLVTRGFDGKAMYVGVDKATAVRMYDLVQVSWADHLATLEERLATTPAEERAWLEGRIEFMRATDMAVVVSQSQNELGDLPARVVLRRRQQRLLGRHAVSS